MNWWSYYYYYYYFAFLRWLWSNACESSIIFIHPLRPFAALSSVRRSSMQLNLLWRILIVFFFLPGFVAAWWIARRSLSILTGSVVLGLLTKPLVVLHVRGKNNFFFPYTSNFFPLTTDYIRNYFYRKRCNRLFGQGYILMQNCVLINHASLYLFIIRHVCTNIIHIYCVIISIEIHRELKRELERVLDDIVSQYKRFYRSRWMNEARNEKTQNLRFSSFLDIWNIET